MQVQLLWPVVLVIYRSIYGSIWGKCYGFKCLYASISVSTPSRSMKLRTHIKYMQWHLNISDLYFCKYDPLKLKEYFRALLASSIYVTFQIQNQQNAKLNLHDCVCDTNWSAPSTLSTNKYTCFISTRLKLIYLAFITFNSVVALFLYISYKWSTFKILTRTVRNTKNVFDAFCSLKWLIQLINTCTVYIVFSSCSDDV